MANARRQSTQEDAPIPLSQHLQAKAWLVWVKQATSLYRHLSNNVIREVCQFIAFRPLLAHCERYAMIVCDPIDRQQSAIDYRHFGLYINFKTLPSCVCIGEYEFFVCGGRTDVPSRSSFLLDRSKVVPRRDMLQGRCLHALYYHEVSRRVFAFGGEFADFEETKTCEQYDFYAATWTPLPNMLKLTSCLVTCGYQGKIFLCACFRDCLEVFTIATLKFAFVPLSLPPSQSPKSAVVWKNQLIVIQNEQMWMLDAHSLEMISLSKLHRRWTFSKQPIVVNDSIVVFERGFHSFDLQQAELKISTIE